jgi:glycosyltransferase involved in cell wall biosynthesis
MTVAGGLRVLHAIHDFLPQHRAGSEIYVAALCRELGTRHHVTVLTTEYDLDAVHANVRWRVESGISVIELVNNWQGTFVDTYDSPLITARLGQILDTIRPHVLHVHSLLNLSLALPALARTRGIPVVATLHDYTLVCPSGGQRVHRAEAHICHEIEPERCARCFSESVFSTKLAIGAATSTSAVGSLGRHVAPVLRRHLPRLAAVSARAVTAMARSVGGGDITTRLHAAREAMQQFSLVVSPSRSVANEYRHLGMPAARVSVSDYGFVPLTTLRKPVRKRRPLRAAYMGSLVWHKGLHVLLDAVAQLPRDAIQLTIFGNPAVDPAYVGALQRKADGLPVRFAGAFDDDRRGEVLGEIDVLVVPSIWLENSPLVIHEAFLAGVPVIGSHIGGIAELIEHNVNGFLVEPGSADALAAALRRCAEDEQLIARLSASVPVVKSIAQDALEWDIRYRQVIADAANSV